MFRDRADRLHFIGIGGIGMSGIAEVLLNLGYDVRGSDISSTSSTRRLQSMGATVHAGHARAHVADAEVVVVSSAIDPKNPEVIEARSRGIPVIPRAEMLAELMRLKYGIAVAGSHGKTTTTSLIATTLDRGGIDPTMVIGGRLRSISSNAKLGEGEYLVAEADESDGSFLKLIPTIAVITNIDREHLDHWKGGLDQIVDAFVEFANKVPFYGASVVCLDHPTVQAALPRFEKRYVTYGFSAQADYAAEEVEVLEGRMRFVVKRRGEVMGNVDLAMIGRHNILNALAAIAVAEEVGVDFSIAAQALGSFEGIGRRFEIKGEARGVLVVDDYGHHPAEIRATLEAAREAYRRRLVVAFQPHRYSRTRDLLAEFAGAFNASDFLVVGDIFAASEEPIPGIDAEALIQTIRQHGHQNVVHGGDLEAMVEVLDTQTRAGDLVLTLGAGSVGRIGDLLLQKWNEAIP